MAKTPPKPPTYDTEGFAGAHQARGLSPTARKFLESKGALAERTPGSAASKRAKAAEAGAKTPRKKSADTTAKSGGDVESELPRRSRKARSLKARHFRLPLDIDAKRQDVAEFHDSTLVWVVCKLIQEEWVRTRRALRRDQPASGEAAPPDGSDEGEAP